LTYDIVHNWFLTVLFLFRTSHATFFPGNCQNLIELRAVKVTGVKISTCQCNWDIFVQ